MSKERIGLIDIGSNTVRLVIFEIDEYFTVREIQNIKSPARLYQYLDENKRMAQEGIEKLLNILNSFQHIAEQYHVDTLMPMATAAIRQSANREDILSQAKARAGIEITIVPEENEAMYGQYAVIHSTQSVNGITIDIGGGSTEVTWYKDKQLIEAHSFPFGVVTLKTLFFTDKDHNDSKAIKKAREFVKSQFQTLPWLSKKELPIIAIGGSARNIASIHQRQTAYPIAGIHGYRMQREDLEYTYQLLKKSSLSDLEELDGLSRDRIDIILPANIVFNALYDEVKAPVFLFSRKGLREGIIMEYINNKYESPLPLHNVGEHAVAHLARTYRINPKPAEQRVAIVSKLYDAMCQQQALKKDAYWEKFLFYGAYLYFLGSFIDADEESPHTFYIISNSNLNGLSHKERVMVALLASYKNKSLFRQYTEKLQSWFTPEEVDWLQSLGGLIKFGEALNDSHVNTVKEIHLKKTAKQEYALAIEYTGDVLAEEYRSNRQKKHIERILGGTLNISLQGKT